MGDLGGLLWCLASRIRQLFSHCRCREEVPTKNLDDEQREGVLSVDFEASKLRRNSSRQDFSDEFDFA